MYTTWQTVCSEHIIFVSTKSGGEYICFWHKTRGIALRSAHPYSQRSGAGKSLPARGDPQVAGRLLGGGLLQGPLAAVQHVQLAGAGGLRQHAGTAL